MVNKTNKRENIIIKNNANQSQKKWINDRYKKRNYFKNKDQTTWKETGNNHHIC